MDNPLQTTTTFDDLMAVSTYPRNEAVAFRNKGKYAILSNFYPFTFEAEGHTFHSSEQYYHWRRLQARPDFQQRLLSYDGDRNAWLCFNYSRNKGVKQVIETDLQRRIDYMRQGLQYKLRFCPGFKEALLATGSRPIVEINQTSKPDDIWAVNKEGDLLVGSNLLGKLLMEARLAL